MSIPPETKERIAASVSATMRERFIEEAKQRDPSSEPTEKRCPRCKETKSVSEFGARKSTLKCGLVSVTPRTNCRRCEAKRTQEWKERKIAQGTWKEYAARQQASRDPVKRREYQREYATMRRRKAGVKPMKYRKPPKTRVERRDARDLPTEPISVLVEVLEGQGLSRAEISNRSGVQERRLYDMRYLNTPATSIDNVDRLLMAFDREDELDELYPLEEEEQLVGYAILDPEGILDQKQHEKSAD